MVPSAASTARYKVHTPYQSHATNCPGRNFCVVDWCKLHPKGTLGEFNQYYDNLPAGESQVCPWSYTPYNNTTDKNLGLQTERKGCCKGTPGMHPLNSSIPD